METAKHPTEIEMNGTNEITSKVKRAKLRNSFEKARD